MSVAVCPKCKCQIEVKLLFASGPKSSSPQADSTDLGDLLDLIDMQALDDMSFEFITKTKDRYKKYKEDTQMSEKQMAWVRKLAEGKF